MDERNQAHDQAAWLADNQRYLVLWLTFVRGVLQRHAARAAGASGVPGPPLDPVVVAAQGSALAAGMVQPPALDRLAAAFGLNRFETLIVVLCAGVELDAAIAGACAAAAGDGDRGYPTFGIALAALPDAHWSALEPEAPLRAWRLVELVNSGGSPSAPLTTRPLRLDERILHFLIGVGRLDERVARITTVMPDAAPLVPSHEALAGRIARAWRYRPADDSPAVVLHGADLASAAAIASAAARQCERSLLSMHASGIPAVADEQARLARLWDREARLDAAGLFVEADDTPGDAARAGALRDWADRVTGPLIIAGRERVTLGRRSVLALDVGRPRREEQRALWTAALRAAGVDGSLDLRQLTAQFRLNASEVRSAVDAVMLDGGAIDEAALWEACRQQARGALDSLAQRIESRAGFDDLVLPDDQKETLAEIVTHVRHRAVVYDDWGFAGRGSRGLGISALFAGSSGTGKTMAAEVLAVTLGLDLYRVDLSAVVSKYIGETEKNLRRIFDAAETGGAVLLFDEADALFGKRSEVKDSHDRYANVEVGYLLQRMESYEGLAILTTNLRSALDTAFMRRIRFIVEFPFPDVAERAQIWLRAFPASTPTSGLDVVRLAQLSVAGGGIKNVALGAAFLAADANEPVGMAHVLRAARSEYAKLARPLTDAEVAGWVQAASC